MSKQILVTGISLLLLTVMWVGAVLIFDTPSIRYEKCIDGDNEFGQFGESLTYGNNYTDNILLEIKCEEKSISDNSIWFLPVVITILIGTFTVMFWFRP